MEVESVHSATEGKLKGRQIFWPAEYIDVITAARRDHVAARFVTTARFVTKVTKRIKFDA